MSLKTQDNSAGRFNMFEALFDHATIGIVVTDTKGKIINFNRQAQQDFGYTRQEILQQPLEILLPPSAEGKHSGYRSSYYEKPAPRAMGAGRDLYAQKKDGSVFPVEVSLSSYTSDEELFVIAFVIDITVRKEHEKTVLQQKEELERITREIKQLNITLEKKIDDRTKMLRETLSALEQSKLELSDALQAEKDLGDMKSKFVSMASHEFKTPLSTILSSAFLLEKYNDRPEPEKRARHINRIKNAVNDMRLILDDFLSLDKLDEGIVYAQPAEISANSCFEALDEVIQDMKVHCKKGQTFRTRFTGTQTITLDDRILKNICINLLSNAIKFSPENSTIFVDCAITAEKLILSIRDQGIGISEEDQKHLFERFFRAGNAVNIQGTGLGLNIVTRYVALMNGSIEFESELEKGSVFTVHIPQQQLS